MSTCSYCWNSGHNKRKCPERIAHLNTRAADGNVWASQELKDMKSRTCSYCGKKGHDRRKCEPLEESTDKMAEIIHKMRDFTFKAAGEYGFGVGTLLKWEDSWYDGNGNWRDRETRLGIAENVRWAEAMPSLLAPVKGRAAGAMPSGVGRLLEVRCTSTNKKVRLYFPFEIQNIRGTSKESLSSWDLAKLPSIVSVSCCTMDDGLLTVGSCKKAAKAFIKDSGWKKCDVEYCVQKYAFLDESAEEA